MGNAALLDSESSYHNFFHDGNSNRPRVLTRFQFNAWMPLDAQSPDSTLASLPGMVRFWLEEQYPGGRFPIEAIRGEEPFPDAASGLLCETLALRETRSWSFKLSHPDADVGGRTWHTELAYRQLPDRILFGARVSCSILANRHIPAAYTVPGIVRYALNRIGMRDCAPITCRAKTIDTIDDLLALKRMLTSTDRTIPLIVLSEISPRERLPGALDAYALDADRLADDLLGLAHVVKLPWRMAYEWTKAVDKEWSVYNGAVRTYYPHFDFAAASPWAHPTVIAGRILAWRPNERYGEGGFHDFLCGKARQYSSSRQVHWGDLLFLDDAQAAKNHIDYNRIYEQAIDDIDGHNQKIIVGMKAKFDAERAQYLSKINSLEKEAEQYNDDAIALSGEVERYRRLNYSLRARIDALSFELQQLRSADAAAPSRNPQSYEDVEDWIISTFPESIYLHPRAARRLRDAEYEDIDRLCDAIRLLAGPYRDMRRGILSKAKFDALLQARHKFHIEWSTTESEAGRQGDAYYINYPASTPNIRFLELHLAHGNSYEPRYCLRIYFFWDKAEEVIVIGWMPSHLDNRLT